ncbi:MAG: HAMP domain-containing histidine kinase [Anaerolineae bacterium]|nr:HAMP domain-containing histidine kinase [Anaerolineae bacterium]
MSTSDHGSLLTNDHSSRLEAEIAELRKQNALLKQQVADDAIEIQATVDEFNRAQEELILAKEEIERANKAKTAFLASMSHELRTPLNAILNFSQFLSSGLLGSVNSEQVEMLDKITTSGKHLLNLINDVLDISKIESGSLRLFIEDNVDLTAEARTTIDTARALLAGKPVELNLNIANDLIPVLVDKRRIRQIMLNLVSNACKFTETGHISMSLFMKGEQIGFSVQDTGPGIPEEDFDTVFEAFRQTKVGLLQGTGTGLGLAICKRLVEAHQGTIALESKLNVGTTFTVLLPTRSPQLEALYQRSHNEN